MRVAAVNDKRSVWIENAMMTNLRFTDYDQLLLFLSSDRKNNKQYSKQNDVTQRIFEFTGS